MASTKARRRQALVGLPLTCRSAYRGVEVLRDLLGLPVSLRCVHDVLAAAPRQASAINQGQDLSGICVGLHDATFQGATPVRAPRRCGPALMPSRLTLLALGPLQPQRA